MEYRTLGALDVQVSAIGFGAASISGEGGGYGFGHISEAAAIALVHGALERGINLFDTAPIYGFGMAERRLGKALKGHRRDKAFIVSKCGLDWDASRRVGLDNRPETTRRMIEQSLRDLDTDRIDLYLVHWPDPNVDIRRPMEVMVRAQEEGKLRAVGLSNTSPEDLEKAQEIGSSAAVQGQMSLFENGARDTLFPHLNEPAIGFMSWGTLEKGILTGRVKPQRTFDAVDVRSYAPWWTQADHRPHYATMERLAPLFEESGHSGLEIALGHVLDYAVTSTALCGARTLEQLDGLVAALANLPSKAHLAEARTLQQRVFAEFARET
ncbi:MAG: aldo/keto reductase [Myxococcota bacterium]|nr:aldo/keto reductase [Myxococcota bacterium]